MRGSWISARQRLARCSMPPESCHGIAAAKALQADLLEQRIGLVAELGLAQPAELRERNGSTIFSGNMMFCSIVIHGSMVGFWNAMPTRSARAATFAAADDDDAGGRLRQAG